MSKIKLSLLAILGAINLFIMIVLNSYALVLNTSGHSGFSPYLLLLLLIPSLVINCYYFVKKHDTRNLKILFLILFIIPVLGIINVIVFDVCNILLSYEIWIQRGLL